jgi:hypothetical protein
MEARGVAMGEEEEEEEEEVEEEESGHRILLESQATLASVSNAVLR